VKKRVLLIGGITQVAFGLLHLGLAMGIHSSQSLSADDRALMQMLNVGSMLMSLFFAYVSFFHRDELLATKLGNANIVFISLLYFTRAVGEIVLFDFSPVIFGLCLVVGMGYLSTIVSRTNPIQPSTPSVG
jgi:hypothetical protein